MENNNQARDNLYEQEIKLLEAAVSSLDSPDNIPEEALDKINDDPELVETTPPHFDEELVNVHDPHQTLDADVFSEIYLRSSEGFGRYNTPHKYVERRAATQRAKKRQIDRWRSEQRYGDGGLKWSEGYLCREYNKAKKALKDDKDLKEGKSLKKVVPLRWWEKKSYSETIQKHKKYVRFAKRYNVYSATKQRYFVRLPKVQSELKTDGEVRATASVTEAPKKDLNFPPIKRLTFVRGKPYPAPVNPSPTLLAIKPASSYSLASFFRGIAGHLSYCMCPFIAIKAQITGRK